jgi:hypothetical protein
MTKKNPPPPPHTHKWSDWADVGMGLDEARCDCGAVKSQGNGKSPGEDDRR